MGGSPKGGRWAHHRRNENQSSPHFACRRRRVADVVGKPGADAQGSLKNGVWFLMEAEVGFTEVIYLDWSDMNGFPGALTGN